MNTPIKIASIGLCLAVAACGIDSSNADETSGEVESAMTSTWPYPVPTGCVALATDPTMCDTNVGHFDISEARASLTANMAAAGWTGPVYSPNAFCRTTDAWTKGKTRVCYKVGVLENAQHQATGSRWIGRLW